MLIWIASYPRSGSRLTRTALRSGWGIEERSVFDRAERARRRGSRRPWRRPGRDPVIRAMRRREGPQPVKTHLLEHAPTADPAIVLVRDGRDAVVSFTHLLRSGRGGPAELAEWDFERALLWVIETAGPPFGTWSESVSAWRRRTAPTEIVRFEQLREDPQGVVRRALGALGFEAGPPARPMPSLEQMQDADPVLVRGGRVGDWRREMPQAAVERFAELHGPELVALGYERSADPADWHTAGRG